jgi:chromosome condensin MukBEF MukE localization factor
MRCFKLLGERVMARDFDRQVAELQVRAAVLNRFTRLGTRSRSQCYKTNYK